MRSSFRTRLFISFFAVIVVSLLIPAFYVRQQIHATVMEEARQRAISEAHQIRSMLTAVHWTPASLAELVRTLGGGLGMRMTLVSQSGAVLADSEAHATSQDFDDHSDRPEITEAERQGSGVSIRFSNTFAREMVYAAVAIPKGQLAAPLDQGGFVRVALPLSFVRSQINTIFDKWWWVLCGASALALVFSLLLARRIESSIRDMVEVVRTVAAGTGRHRVHHVPGREFAHLAKAVNTMANRIEHAFSTIEAQKAQLETILDIMEEGVLVLGPQGRIRMVNATLERLFPGAQQGVGRHPVEVIFSAPLQTAIDALLAQPHDMAAVTSLQIEPRRDLILSVQLVRPQRPVHDVVAVAVFHDVTELVRLMRVRRDFVANVSHELRTPLTAIQGYAETLADLSPDDAAMRDRCVRTIRRHAEHMGHMVEDLLTLARLESASLPLELEETPLAELFQQSASLLDTQAAARGLSIHIDVPQDLRVTADSHFIGQVIRNLLENAIRYGKDGTSIELAASLTDDAVLVSVRDQGPGIAPTDMSRIFERFYRAEPHRSGTASTGLGLAICKHVVERHGGRIWAENTPGATIRFTLPKAPSGFVSTAPTPDISA